VKLVLASNNAGKLSELRALLEPHGLELVSQRDLGVHDAEETALTFVENALIKARHAATATGLAAIADDSGLVVPSLGGEPGIRSARYSGRHGDDAANNRRLIERLADRDDRRAYFYCALVLLRGAGDPAPIIATASWWGAIARAPRGERGFGYDPLFLVAGSTLTAAEMDAADKNRVSHRGQAMRALLDALERAPL
jgi:XTP/dITP diphosphohydrolase